MSGTYTDPKGKNWHVPGKVDHSPESAADALVDGNGNPTKATSETLVNGDLGDKIRGQGQTNISATPGKPVPAPKDNAG